MGRRGPLSVRERAGVRAREAGYLPRWFASFIGQRIAAFGPAVVLGFLGGVLALVGFADLSENVMSQQTMHLDYAVLFWLRQAHAPILDALALVASAFGTEILAVVLVLALVHLGRTHQWTMGIALILVTVGAQLLNNVLKDFFHRTRPAPLEGFIPAQAFSFPSGHAMVAAAFYGFLAYLAWRSLPGWRRPVMVGLLLGLILLIGVSRLYLGVHYASDVFAGYVAGFLWTDAVVLADTVRHRGWRLRRGTTTTVGQVP
jgi:membrane-associated phospholipid phosphatase